MPRRLKTGAPLRDLPDRPVSEQTVYCRRRRWRQAGIRPRVLAALQAEADAAGDFERAASGSSPIPSQ